MRCAPSGLGLRHISLRETSHTAGTLSAIHPTAVRFFAILLEKPKYNQKQSKTFEQIEYGGNHEKM